MSSPLWHAGAMRSRAIAHVCGRLRAIVYTRHVVLAGKLWPPGSCRTQITIRSDLTWASERVEPALQGQRLARPLEPAAHAGFVVSVGVAEPPFQVRLLARD